MLRLGTDADFNGDLINAVLRLRPELDIVRVQDVGMRTAGDPQILAWAAAERRALLTHDRDTMIDFAYERVRIGLPMSGLVVVRQPWGLLGNTAEDIVIVAVCSTPEEFENRVEYVPL